ncbi:MAG: molybdopterin-dependent oxidoreductase [Myxococcota bacterium]
MATPPQTHFRTCNICEAMCGLAIEHADGAVLSIRGDAEDPFSQGHICPKAVALQDYYADPDRLRTPVRKTAQGWEEMSWDAALDEVASRIRGVQAVHGPNAVGVYLGNPNAHNFGNALMLPHFFKALGTRARYSSASADQLPHHVASNFMFGAGLLIPVPDIDRTDFLLVVGGNPAVSNGSMMTAAGVSRRIKAIRERGGKVVVVDPRRTETARLADTHLFIRPERDALFLMAMIHTLFEEGRVDLGHLEPLIEGLDVMREVAQPFSPERVAPATGIAAADIRKLALDMASAPSAVCYARMGASTQSYGGLCQWLNNVFNLLTANCDKAGGAMFPEPAFDLVRRSKKGKPNSYGRHTSRVRGLPFFNGEFPVATLAEEITTPGEGQLKSLVTIAGNPVLSSPNGPALAEAFQQLDFMVSVDIYLNETTKHADIILPSTTGLEVGHYDVFFNAFAVSNNAKYSPPLFEKSDDQRHDWQILKALAARWTGIPEDEQTPEDMLDLGLRTGAYGGEGMSLAKLLEHPHGMHLGPLRPCLEARLMTADDRVHLAPQFYLDDVPRLEALLEAPASLPDYPLQMISRRLLRSHNTWTHNAARLVKGKNPCTLQMSEEDARALGVTSGQMVAVRSAVGEIEIEAEVNDDLMPGVVSVPQGWGHNQSDTRMTVAATQPGVSINDLTDPARVDPLTGNAALNGTPVAVVATSGARGP